MTTRLSVCITTYNRAALLDSTLASLSSQTRQLDELIISDDCSPDNTAQVVEKWRTRFPQLLYNKNPRNFYMPGNLNAAVRMATGEYVANLHDADEFAPTLLEDWEKALDNHLSAGFVFCGVAGGQYEAKFNDGITIQSKGITLHNVSPITAGQEFFERFFLHRFSSIVWGTVMARRSAYDKLLPFDVTFGFVSDVDMWMRMCLYYDVAYVRKPLIILDHSPSKERGSGNFNWGWLDASRKMQEINIKRFYNEQPERLRREMRRHSKLVQWVYAQRILGRLRSCDWNGVKEGLGLCRNLGWPMKWAGRLARG
jgi:glycosyltransferase involved in cell wall biosynthesis